jgi:helix-turn-helix protein
MSEDVLLTPKEVAARVHRSDRALQRWRQTRQGPPFIKLGSRILYPEDAFLEWLSKKQRFRSTSDYGGGNVMAWCGLFAHMRSRS